VTPHSLTDLLLLCGSTVRNSLMPVVNDKTFCASGWLSMFLDGKRGCQANASINSKASILVMSSFLMMMGAPGSDGRSDDNRVLIGRHGVLHVCGHQQESSDWICL
jgi:hypothetical protein